MDPDTKRDFFDRNPGLLECLQVDAVPAVEAMKAVADFIARYPPGVTLVAKPAAVDVPWLRYLMDTYGPDDAPSIHPHRVLCLQTRLQTTQALLGIDRGTFQGLLRAHRLMFGASADPSHVPLDDCLAQIADFYFTADILSKLGARQTARVVYT